MEYYGYLEKGEGFFEIIDCKTHFSGSVQWSKKVRSRYNSVIEEFTNVD